MENTFLNSQEGIFIRKLIEIIESMDLDEFTFLCGDYDKVKTLDKLQIKLLSKIKENIGGINNINIDKDNGYILEQEIDLC